MHRPPCGEPFVSTCRFDVEGLASADLPLRVLNLFAQQGIVVDAVEVRRRGDHHAITTVADLPVDRATVILEKIRSLVLVAGAELSRADQ